MNEEFFSYRPPTKGHVAHPHGQEQPLGTHTLPDEAHLRVHDILYQVLEKILRLIFVKVECISKAIHALIESERDHL